MAGGGRSRLKYVVDACLWIDLNFGGITTELFKLPFEIISPDVILEELESCDPDELRRLGVIEASLSPEDMEALTRLRITYSKPGLNDLAALTVAKQQNLHLMTGDGDLREAAKVESVKTVGILWVLDMLVEEQIIDPYKAAEALEKMLNNNARLPKAECNKRFNKWR